MRTKEELVDVAHENLRPSKIKQYENEKYLIPRTALRKNPFKENKLESLPFLSGIANGLKDNSKNQKKEFARQFVLTGQPSAGKSTELKRIARKLVNDWDEQHDFVVNLCCLQNSSATQTAIQSKEDLWNWIMKSHESRVIAHQRYSLKEFIELHISKSTKPILLIDTVDLLIYGKIGDENSEIIGYWIELIEELKSHEATVLWTCRRFEYIKIQKYFDNSQILLEQIELPHLDPKKVYEEFSNVKKSVKNAQDFFTVLGVDFPIIVGYKKDPRKWDPKIEKDFINLHEETRKYPIDDYYIQENAGPVNWILECLAGKLATDILYDGLKEKVWSRVEGLYHFKRGDIEKAWEGLEISFFNSAAHDSEVSRIQVQKEVIDDLPQKILVEALVNNAKKFGIISQNKHDSPYEMSHQLFVEYCVWKHRKRKANWTEWIYKFPSCVFRTAESRKIDEDIIDELQNWFRCHIIFNRSLATSFNGREDLSAQWKYAIKNAKKVLKIKEDTSLNQISESDDIHHQRTINPEKHEILSQVNTFDPFLVNGPPGVGKSHLSYVWIDKKASKDINWHALKPNEIRQNDSDFKEKAYFMTLSQKLKVQIMDKVEEYYDNCPKPVDFESWDISEYISRLESTLGLKIERLEYADFVDEWKKVVRGGDGYILQADKVGVQALWNEFENLIIDKYGGRMAPKTYSNKSRLFEYSSSPSSTALEFAKWAENVGGRSHQSLAERSGHCIKKLLEVFENGTHSQKEEILSLQPNILVLDEIQDLPFQSILLMLMMHHGGRDSVMMCGDDEQTLELIRFDWNQIFSRISTSVFEIFEEYSNSEFVKTVDKKWGKSNTNLKTLQNLVQTDTHHLKEVERCVPKIVEFMKDSWKTSVSVAIDPFVETDIKKGTANIVPGRISKARALKNKTDKIETGIELYKEVSEEDLIYAAAHIYENGLDIAILLPNEQRHSEFSKLLEEKNIKLEVWTPRLIKGLEYPIVIAADPWNITKSHFENVVNRPDLENWNDTQKWYLEKKQNRSGNGKITQIPRTITAIELITKQRKRHANIMLSRARNQLIVALLKEEKRDSLRTEIPSSSTPMAKPFPVSELVNEENKLDKNHGINRLIIRLALIIMSSQTSEDRKQVSFKSGHIIRTLETRNAHELTLPFYLIQEHPQMNEELQPISLFDRGLEEFVKKMGITTNQAKKNSSDKDISARNTPFNPFASGARRERTAANRIDEIITNSKNLKNRLPEVERFLVYIKITSKLAFSVDGNTRSISLPIGVVQNYHEEINSFIRKFSEIDEKCFEETENSRELDRSSVIISQYIMNSFFGGLFKGENKRNGWIENAQRIDLNSYSVEINLEEAHNHRFKLLLPQSKGEMEHNKMSNEEKDAFWREGIEYLNNGKINVRYLEEIIRNICDQVDEKNTLPYSGILFLSKSITNIIRSGEYDINEICGFCLKLEVQRQPLRDGNSEDKDGFISDLYESEKEEFLENCKPALQDVFTVLGRQDSKILAQQLQKNLEQKIVKRCLIEDSNGLFQVFAEYSLKAKNIDASYIQACMTLGGEMYSNHADKLDQDAVWNERKLKQLARYCLKVFEKPSFGTTFPSGEGTQITFEEIFPENPYAAKIRKDLSNKGKRNVIDFLLSINCKAHLSLFDGNDNSMLIRRILESLPFDSGHSDGELWKAAMDGSEFAERIVRIPYNGVKYRSYLGELSDDVYFGRSPGFFQKPSHWNQALIELLEEMNIKNQISVKNKDFELKKFSVFDDIYDGHEKRANIRPHIYTNLRDIEWLRNLIDSPLLDTRNEKINVETYGIIPHLNLRETVSLVKQIYNFFNEIGLILSLAMSRTADELKTYNAAANRFLPEDLMQDIVKQAKRDLSIVERYKLSKAHNDFKKYMKGINQSQTKLVKDLDLATNGILEVVQVEQEGTFLIDFVNFFHEKLRNGSMRYRSNRHWKSLFDDFLKYKFPNTFSLLKGSGFFGGNPLSLEGGNWASNIEAQKSLVTLLQSFGQKKRINVVMLNGKYPVVRRDLDHIADLHFATLEKMTSER